MYRFTINDRRFTSPRSPVTVAWLLEQAGIDSPGAVLVRVETGEKWTDPTAEVDLRDGDAFGARPGQAPPDPGGTRIRYTVNGERQVTAKTPLTLEEILRRAGSEAAIDTSELESYYLDNVRTGARYENLGDEVPIADGDQFMALYAGRTPVA